MIGVGTGFSSEARVDDARIVGAFMDVTLDVLREVPPVEDVMFVGNNALARFTILRAGMALGGFIVLDCVVLGVDSILNRLFLGASCGVSGITSELRG